MSKEQTFQLAPKGLVMVVLAEHGIASSELHNVILDRLASFALRKTEAGHYPALVWKNGNWDWAMVVANEVEEES